MKNTIDLQYLRSIKAVISLQGREYLTHEGLLRVAHEHGLQSIESELVSWDPATGAAVIRTTARGERGTYTGFGDATPDNVAKHLKGATLRMAETRAVNRALRLYTGLGKTSTDELPGDMDGDGEEAPTRPGKPPRTTPTEPAPAVTLDALLETAWGLDVPPDVLAAYCVAHGRPTPAEMAPEKRSQVDGWLRDGGAAAVLQWADSDAGRTERARADGVIR